MTILHADSALLPEGWARDVRIEITPSGHFGQIATDAAPGTAIRVATLLPAPANVHSHAFQRAMAGLSETRGPQGRDSFWTWRQLMFRFLDQLTVEDIRAITAMVQMEMLEAGYAASGEFHYLHHQPGGTPYDNLAETAVAICEAAQMTGIGLTLLPVHYQFGGVDQRPLAPGQIRFGTKPDQFLKLLEASQKAAAPLPADTAIGVAPHSLRAVAPDTLREIAKTAQGPVHMHLAEQVPEVEEVEAAYGARPVTWMLENCPPDPRWCLIHCTQMTPEETQSLAATGAVAGLCPITEASLGDGIFDGARWLESGGRIGVGSDSNIRIALSEELRQLEYSQRLRDRGRAILANPGGSTGRRLFDAVCAGGAQAVARNSGRIATGALADFIALDGSAPDLAGRSEDQVLDTWIFARDDRLVSDVWSAGRHMVQQGRHKQHEAISAAFGETLARLSSAI
ncbi:formimidoylglutamate deiminase [Arenibacterium halophilum]|uniref:Formimidoylglutamate deiminase n=1 Tax=Arenibacterium halophilum TaxID=2583821 RepID=A0ABY2XDC1_9RHOB|nr:formimidoylglutamate deiminase [Arenibacterium halophilum]TMV15020.1 formimidoylglutamate deiminase [Arenibacterium halophilum]